MEFAEKIVHIEDKRHEFKSNQRWNGTKCVLLIQVFIQTKGLE